MNIDLSCHKCFRKTICSHDIMHIYINVTFDYVKSFPGSHQNYFYFVTDYAQEMMEELFNQYTVDR